jgi:hypothetical protein
MTMANMDTGYGDDLRTRRTRYVAQPNITTAEGVVSDYGLRDRVRWGPVWAGLITAIASFVLLTVAAVAIGAQAVDSGADGDAAGMAGGIASAVIALAAFFVGGFVAARTAGVIGRGYGALNGFLVWALGVVIILALAAFGLGSLFGASGDLFAQYQQMGQPQADVDANAAVEGIRNGSIGALIGMLLPAVAAALGGWIGSREEEPVVDAPEVVVDHT